MDRRSIVLGGAVLAAGVGAAAASAEAAPAKDLTIYHLEGRRSERIVWLCEELGIPYTLVFKRGDLAGSMATIRGVSPLMAVAPTVKWGDQIIVESGGIIQLLLDNYGKGRLRPALSSPDYPYYLQWLHYAEGSLASRIIADYRVELIQGLPKTPSRLVDAEGTVRFADDYVSRHPWFGGAEFSAADIIMLFPLNLADVTRVVDLAKFPAIIAWRKKIEARPAYQRMLAKARPDGMIGALKPLPGR